jgi:hypothetical protein
MRRSEKISLPAAADGRAFDCDLDVRFAIDEVIGHKRNLVPKPAEIVRKLP